MVRHCIGIILACFALTSVIAPPAAAAASDAKSISDLEDAYYGILTLPLPPGVQLEPGALRLMPDGKLAVSTRIGDIWMVENPFSTTLTDLKWTRYASGLHEVLGLAYREGWLYCTQRGEVSRMKDTDNDGRADVFETFNDDWGIGGDYHEYAFGSHFDREGNLWVVLCLTGSFTSENAFRGWCLRITPDGKSIPTCSGIRSPGGIGMNSAGDMFYTDNQGPWNGACALKHLVPGDFMGNPEGNKWYSLATNLGPRPTSPKSGSRMMTEAKKIPQLRPPAIYFPYPKMGQSASGIACDTTQGRFGAFRDQLFVGDQTHSTVMRVCLEKVQDHYQGACFPFRSGFASGSLSLLMNSDGSMFVGGTDRGWGARGGKPFALQRLVWKGITPFEILEMHARPDGFEFTFTEPVDAATARSIASYTIETYTYIYQASYGSPEVDLTTPTLSEVKVAPDGKSVRLIIQGLQEGHVHEVHLPGVRSAKGQPLLHPSAYYTLNYLPTM